MLSKILDLLFKTKQEPQPKPEQTASSPTMHYIVHPAWSRQMMVDDMMLWVADCGPEFTRRTMYTFLRVAEGKTNLMYAMKNGEVIGFVAFKFLAKRVHIERIAVNPVHRRCGAGRFLLMVMQSSLTPYRDLAIASVPVECLPAQMFFKACGWRAITEKDGRIVFQARRVNQIPVQ